MTNSQRDFAVGAFVLAAFGLLMWGTFQIGGFPGLFGQDGRRLVARFDNVAGLDLETDVLLAGVTVGKVERIQLEGHEARVTVRIEEPELEIPVDSVVAIRSRGLLGERLLEIEPGKSDQQLLDGGAFTRTQAAASVDLLIDQVTNIATDFKEVSATMRNVLGGPEGEEALQEILANIRAVTGDLRRVVERNEEGIERIVTNLDAFSTDIAEITGDNREGIEAFLGGLQQASDKLNEAIDNLLIVSQRIEKGEGTLGKLLSDESLYNEVDAAVADVRTALREVRRAAEETQEQIPATILTTIFGSLF